MDSETRWKIIRFLVTALSLYGIWLLFTASIEWYSLIMGAVGSVVIAAVTYPIFIPWHQANLRYFFGNPIFGIWYAIVLVWMLYGSSIVMVKAVITKNTSPRIVHFRTRLKSDVARMVLANSITLTPGTITLDVNDDHLTVHWLFCDTHHAKAAGEEVKGRMENFIKKVWL